MSEIKVNKISPRTGTAFTVGDSGDTFTVPSGATLTVAGALNVTGTTALADGTVNVAELDIDGATDIGEAIVDADLFVIDNGAGGTNRKTAASRLTTYILGANSIDSDMYVDGSIDNAHLADDAVDSDEIAAGAIDLAHMSSESVDEDNLHISNAGSNGQALTKQSGNSGGLTWASAGASVLNDLTDVSMDITNFVDGILIQTDTDGSAPGTGTLSTATGNIGIGKDVFAALTDGKRNTAIGYQAADALTGGLDNIMIGKDAGGATTTGNDNVYIGRDAGKTLTTAGQNIAIGNYAMDGATDLVVPNNLAIGCHALSGALASGATNNVAVGNYSFEDLTIAKYSTAVGANAGMNVTTGYANTCLGYYTGTQTTTGDYNTFLGYGAGAAANNTTRAIALGQDVTAASNDFSFGRSGNVVTNDFDADANWSRASDVRLKKNITDQKLGLDFINDLRTIKYNWKPSTELDENDAALNQLRVDKDSNPVDHEDFDGTVVNNMNTTATMHNFIAQEVKAALDKEGVSDFGGWKEDQYGVQQVSREMFIIPLVKAVQELSAKVDTLEAKVAVLEG